MKKVLLFLIVPFLLMLVGCAETTSSTEEENTEKIEASTEENEQPLSETTDEKSNSDDTELKQAFNDYVDDLRELTPEETRLIALYDSVTGNNYTDDETLYYTLVDEIIPGYRDFVNNLEGIMPKNQEIRELHEDYIQAANIQYGAFTLIISAIEEQDYATVTEANEKLDEARRILRDWQYDVKEISNKTGVSLE